MKKILIIEDDIALASILADGLGQSGYATIMARDGEEGLALALEKKPDLILLDIILPKLDGISMLKKLRQDAWGKTALVIILTNLNSPNDIAEAVEWAQDYLVKADWKIEDIIKHVKEKLAEQTPLEGPKS
jgi:DNA-binding response OmpR family regulator